MHDDYISHYGVKRRSGRYPWGSGDEPFQRGPENTLQSALAKMGSFFKRKISDIIDKFDDKKG